MAKKEKKKLIDKKTRADGIDEYYVNKAPQKTVVGKIVIATLAILLGGSAILALIFALAQA